MRKHRFNWKEERPNYNIHPSDATVMRRLLDSAVSDRFIEQDLGKVRTCIDCGLAKTHMINGKYAKWHKYGQYWKCHKCHSRSWMRMHRKIVANSKCRTNLLKVTA